MWVVLNNGGHIVVVVYKYHLFEKVGAVCAQTLQVQLHTAAAAKAETALSATLNFTNWWLGSILSVEVNEVFGRLDYPHDLSHDLSERTVYIPSASLCCCNQQRTITPSDHGVLVAESLEKDSLLAVI
jgi:hypothetical protein